MPLDRALASSHAWMQARSPLVESLKVPSFDRKLTAASLLHLSIEHQCAIHILLDHRLGGSAIALYRPQFEAYVRGAWIHWCATDLELDKFRSGGEPPGISSLIVALESSPYFDRGVLSSYKNTIWPKLCDYTHGGIAQVQGRLTPSAIEHNFSSEGMVGLLTSSVILSLLSAQSMAFLCDAQEVVQSLQNVYETTYGKAA